MANNHNLITGSETPNFMVWIGTDGESLIGEDASTIEEFEEYAILYSSAFSIRKVIAPNSGSNLFSSSKLQGTPLQITIANGSYVADLENTFARGDMVGEVTIAKLANIKGENQTVETNTFENCYLLSVEPKYDTKTNMDMIKIEIRYNKRTHTIYKYTQDGVLQGQSVSEYDFSTNKTSDEDTWSDSESDV